MHLRHTLRFSAPEATVPALRESVHPHASRALRTCHQAALAGLLLTLPALALAQEQAAAAGVASSAAGTPALAGAGAAPTGGTRTQQDAVLVPPGTGSTPVNPASQPAGLGAQPRVSASGQVLMGTGEAAGNAPGGMPSPPQATPKRPASR